MDMNFTSNVIPFGKAARLGKPAFKTSDESMDGAAVFNPLLKLAYKISHANTSEGKFNIDIKSWDFPQKGDFSLRISYWKQFQGGFDPQHIPYFDVESTAEGCKTAAAFPIIDQKGNLRHEVTELQHQSDFVTAASKELQGWATELDKPYKLRLIPCDIH